MEASEANHLLDNLAKKLAQQQTPLFDSTDTKARLSKAWNHSTNLYTMFFIISRVKHKAVVETLFKTLKKQNSQAANIAYLRLYFSDVVAKLS